MKTKKKSGKSELPFRLKEEVKLLYQSKFLHFVNELAPNVAYKIKRLTPQCRELFGEFPVKDFSDGLYLPYVEDSEQRKLWWKADNVFRGCIWKETRYDDRSYWQKVLGENDGEMKTVAKFLDLYQEKITSNIDKELTENLDNRSLEFTKAADIPPEEVTKTDLYRWLMRSCFEWLRNNDEIYKKAEEIESLKIKKLTEFQSDFDDLLNHFCLNKIWIARSVFRAIWNGTGKLQIEGSWVEMFSDEVIAGIKEKTGQKEPENQKIKPAFFEGNFLPPPKRFVFEERYQGGDFKEYEKKAVAAYRRHLHDYFNAVKKTLKENDYKSTTGAKHDFSRVKWLVRWSVQNRPMRQIWSEFDKSKNKDATHAFERFERKAFLAFTEFEKYDFPVRIKRKTVDK